MGKRRDRDRSLKRGLLVSAAVTPLKVLPLSSVKIGNDQFVQFSSSGSVAWNVFVTNLLGRFARSLTYRTDDLE